MLTGKAVSTAFPGHILLALNTILIANAYNVPVPTKNASEYDSVPQASDLGTLGLPDLREEDIEHDLDSSVQEVDDVMNDLSEARELYTGATTSTVPVAEVCAAEVLTRIQTKLNEEKAKMDMPTSLLWIQYLDMVDILCRFLKAERTGNWSLHLQSIREMLPFFAASGHTLHAKSAYVYLQTMLKLPETNPDIQMKFEKGFHIVRRSDRFWAGLSTDLLIEQVLMRSMKTQGGLTRGKGMTEIQ